MRTPLPRLEGNLLRDPSAGTTIEVGTPEWYEWLETHLSFTLIDSAARLTIRKERGRSGTWYWKAYRRIDGRLQNRYLGRSSDLDTTRLQEAVQALSRPAAGRAPFPDDPSLSSPLAGRVLAPLPQPDWLSREPLVERLARSHDRTIAVIAPAGSGKTGLLALWAATSDEPLAWLTLDAADNDMERLASMIALAVNRAMPGVAERALEDLARSSGDASSAALRQFARDVRLRAKRRGRRLRLVLDDVDRLYNATALLLLAQLFSRPRSMIQLVMTSRSPLPERLAPRQSTTQIQADDLRLPDDAARAALLAELGGEPGQELDRLLAWCAGSVGRLRMLRCALRHGVSPAAAAAAAAAGGQEALADLLIGRMPEAARQAIYTAAALHAYAPALHGELAGASADDPSAVTQLVRPLGDGGGWYGVGRAEAELVRGAAERRSPGALRQIYASAAAWYDRQSLGQEAIEAAHDGGAWDVAAGQIEQRVERLIMRAEWQLLERWISRMPEPVVDARPKLLLALASARMASLTYEVSLAASPGAPRAGRPATTMRDVIPIYARVGEQALQTGDMQQRSYALISLALLRMFTGDLGGALELCDAVSEQTVRARTRVREIDCTIDLCYGLIALERDDLATAEHRLTRSFEQSFRNRLPSALLRGAVALVSLRLAQNDLPLAIQAIAKAERVFSSLVHPRAALVLEALHTRVAIARQERVATEQWLMGLRRARAIEPITMLIERPLVLATIEGLLLLDRVDDAGRVLAHALAQAEDYGHVGMQVALLAQQAAVALRLGQRDRAREALRRALELGDRTYLRSITDGGPAVHGLLREMAEEQPDIPRIAAVAAAAGAVAGGAAAGERLPLSDREARILQMMAQGHRRDQIAHELGISLGTLKSTLHRLYTRLGVRHRGQALVRARGLGLLGGPPRTGDEAEPDEPQEYAVGE